MRVLVVGASGVIGTFLVPQLREAGHEVVGTCRSPGKVEMVRSLGAESVVLDVLDPAAARRTVDEARPDAIIYQSTALSNQKWRRKLDVTFTQTNRLRTEGTDNLLAAAREAGVGRFITQSFAPYRYAREGAPVKTEDDALDPAPPEPARQTQAAMARLDRVVTAAGGIALRYGGFYGDPDGFAMLVRKRQMPIVGAGNGMMSFIHLEDAATATVLALGYDGPRIFNIVDDDPAPMREWLPVLAEAVGAKPPRHLPNWVAQAVMGKGLTMMTEARAASNARAKKELGWTLHYPTWRTGFRAAYGNG